MLHLLLKRLMPKQDEFIVLFGQHVSHIADITTNLNVLLKNGYSESILAELTQSEKKADAVAVKIYQLLNSSFITPFRRGEIRDLIGKMDNIADYAEDVAKRAKIYGVNHFTPEMVQMSEQAHICVGLLQQAMPLLAAISKNAEQINAICEQIHKAEDKADDIYDAGLHRLYNSELAIAGNSTFLSRSPYERLYDLIEEVVDACSDVANVLGSIVAENA